ncbi:MAG TPA: hypothetical protein VFS19_00925, partial [Planctomycetota bacterium]|nr:hypothetical protein [Planctomycetota bacterium]
MKSMTAAALAAFALAVTPQSQEAGKSPPSITYGASRESKSWIKTPDGTSVAVDEGISWKGVTIYLSLT